MNLYVEYKPQECHPVANVVVPAKQEAPQNVDSKHPQPALSLNGHDGKHTLVQNGVPGVLGTLRVGSNLQMSIEMVERQRHCINLVCNEPFRNEDNMHQPFQSVPGLIASAKQPSQIALDMPVPKYHSSHQSHLHCVHQKGGANVESLLAGTDQ